MLGWLMDLKFNSLPCQNTYNRSTNVYSYKKGIGLKGLSEKMKIILSRKGMDSSWGGHPGIILPDNTLLYYPIPGDPDEDSYSDILGIDGVPMDIGMKRFYKDILYHDCWEEITSQTHCHMDPDLDYNAKKRSPGWRGAFGQADAAQTVLANAGVGEGDLFLFFGWYQKCVLGENGKYYLQKNSDVHCIYGYMEIDQVIYTKGNNDIPVWLMDHPHMLARRSERRSNCIYVGREKLSWNERQAGYGLLPYSKNRVLTKEGLTRSKWELPAFFREVSITYHSANSWMKDYFQSAYRGQEFVIDESPAVEAWAKKTIEEKA